MANDRLPILYSFRRCPYAMRARMALYAANIDHEHREVKLSAKPEALLTISPKGTVPVLALTDGEVLEESLDIMHWAVAQSDPCHWLAAPLDTVQQQLIQQNDGPFKQHLDRYKYPERYGSDAAFHRSEAALILANLTKPLEQHDFLMGAQQHFVDIALFPFVRQFAHVDETWFAENFAALYRWLCYHKSSELFQAIMRERPVWSPPMCERVKF